MNTTGVRSAALASLICCASYSVMSGIRFPTLSVLCGDQPVAWAAAMMTRVTAPGWEISDRCPASISVMRARGPLALYHPPPPGDHRAGLPPPPPEHAQLYLAPSLAG